MEPWIIILILLLVLLLPLLGFLIAMIIVKSIHNSKHTPEKELKCLADLHNSGALTDEEFEEKRKQYVDKL